jgi:hypothetical protein
MRKPNIQKSPRPNNQNKRTLLSSPLMDLAHHLANAELPEDDFLRALAEDTRRRHLARALRATPLAQKSHWQ